MQKKELRQRVIQSLKAEDKTLKAVRDAHLLEKLRQSTSYQEAKVIATYLSMGFEYDTAPLIAAALADGKTVLVPKTYGQGRMIFVTYNPDDLEKTAFGLLEPKSDKAVPKTEIDLIHVPGVVFNEQGYRIGHGGGYYDRYLADYEGQTVSLIYPCQQAEFEVEGHDIAVKEVLVDDSSL